MLFENSALKSFLPACLLLVVSCAHETQNKSTVLETRPFPLPGTVATTVIFDQATPELTDHHRRQLSQLIVRAQATDKTIEGIKILAWSDAEYPATGKLKRSAEDLAEKRTQKIRKYLRYGDRLTTENFQTFNMAKRPSLLGQLGRSQDYKLKENFEHSGATATELPDGSKSYSKASKANVIIDYEGTEDNFYQ